MKSNQLKNNPKIIFLILTLSLVFLHQGVHLIQLKPLDAVNFSRAVYDQNGSLLRLTLSGDEQYRIFTPLKDLPKEYIENVLLTEDQYFYWHPGINPFSFVRALISTLSGTKMGASTITMQLVRLREKIYTRNISGKLHQMAKAFWYEFIYDKDTILEAYFNLLPFGGNIEGVGAASQIFFRRQAQDLNLLQAQMLALVPQNPVARSLNQTEKENLRGALERLQKRWLRDHPETEITKAQLENPVVNKKISDLPFLAPHFVNMILRRYGEDKQIKSTLNLNLQNKVEKKIKAYVQSKKDLGIDNAAALLIDTNTRKVLAWVGSADFFDENIGGQIDAILTPRSPASTLKPIIYNQAISEGLIHPLSLLKDTPTSFGAYDPENFDRKFQGPLSANEALIQSRNIPAVALSLQLKKRTLFQILKESGYHFPKDENYYGLAMALGGTEMTMEHLVKLYAALGNLGRFGDLVMIKPKEQRGRTANLAELEKHNGKTFSLFSPESSFLTLQMLEQNPQNDLTYAQKWIRAKNRIAWKTGTSYGFKDAWSIGLVGPYTLAVWVGHFDNHSNNSLIGREIAAPLFFEIAGLLPQRELQKTPEWAYSFGLNVKEIEVCALSGALANEHCPHRKKTGFIPGISPIKVCDLHREVLISKTSGKRLCGLAAVQGDARKLKIDHKVMEFWPSDLLELFRNGGLARQRPPEYDKNCEMGTHAQEGASPLIVSPRNDVTYALNKEDLNTHNLIPFKSVVDAEVRKVFWFVGNQFIGSSAPDQTLFHKLEPGTYKVLVVDDRGRSESRSLKVEIAHY